MIMFYPTTKIIGFFRHVNTVSEPLSIFSHEISSAEGIVICASNTPATEKPITTLPKITLSASLQDMFFPNVDELLPYIKLKAVVSAEAPNASDFIANCYEIWNHGLNGICTCERWSARRVIINMEGILIQYDEGLSILLNLPMATKKFSKSLILEMPALNDANETVKIMISGGKSKRADQFYRISVSEDCKAWRDAMELSFFDANKAAKVDCLYIAGSTERVLQDYHLRSTDKFYHENERVFYCY